MLRKYNNPFVAKYCHRSCKTCALSFATFERNTQGGQRERGLPSPFLFAPLLLNWWLCTSLARPELAWAGLVFNAKCVFCMLISQGKGISTHDQLNGEGRSSHSPPRMLVSRISLLVKPSRISLCDLSRVSRPGSTQGLIFLTRNFIEMNSRNHQDDYLRLVPQLSHFLLNIWLIILKEIRL